MSNQGPPAYNTGAPGKGGPEIQATNIGYAQNLIYPDGTTYQPTYPAPVKMEGGNGYPIIPANDMTSGPIAGATAQPRGKRSFSRRWLIVLVVLAVLIIVAIVVPVAIVVSRRNSIPDYFNDPTITPPSTNTPTPRITAVPNFVPEVGYNTMYVTFVTYRGSSSLCYNYWLEIPNTLTIYPTITTYGTTYTAYWRAPATSVRLSDSTAYPTSTGSLEYWQFSDSVSDYSSLSCYLTGYDYINIAADGTASWISEIKISDSSCSSYYSSDTCTLRYAGYWYQ